MRKWVKYLMMSIIALAILLFVFYLTSLNHIGLNDFGIAYNSWTGTSWVQDEGTGWHLTSPFTLVANVSILPQPVCIGSGARIINCKLVRFKKEGVQEFLRDQGFHYYNSTGTVDCVSSSNVATCTSGLAGILKGYAFSGKQYPFLEIIEELGPQKPTPPR